VGSPSNSIAGLRVSGSTSSSAVLCAGAIVRLRCECPPPAEASLCARPQVKFRRSGVDVTQCKHRRWKAVAVSGAPSGPDTPRGRKILPGGGAISRQNLPHWFDSENPLITTSRRLGHDANVFAALARDRLARCVLGRVRSNAYLEKKTESPPTGAAAVPATPKPSPAIPLNSRPAL
jgi:hypothetical protein